MNEYLENEKSPLLLTMSTSSTESTPEIITALNYEATIAQLQEEISSLRTIVVALRSIVESHTLLLDELVGQYLLNK